MAKPKFTSDSKKIKSGELLEKMDIIALALADQVISGTSTLKIADLEEGQSLLKTLTNYFATVNKVEGVEPPKENAFDGYRKKATGDSGANDAGAGSNSIPAATIPFKPIVVAFGASGASAPAGSPPENPSPSEDD